VTQRQYAAVMSDSLKALEKEARRHADYPATFVTHAEAEEFCLRLSSLSNLPRGAFRLPTEAEWEYAARAGTEGPFGAAKNENGLVGYAWFSKNSGSRIHEVKSLSANPWGLHDLQGNVAEWCSDWYDPEYYKQKGVPSENPTGPIKPVAGRKNPLKLLRGGSWFHGPEYCRVYDRNAANPLERYQFAGFRVVFTGRPEIVGSNQLIEEEKK
jgi:formylglycine-generating enzyme required for sulfatase activity